MTEKLIIFGGKPSDPKPGQDFPQGTWEAGSNEILDLK
jgi:hypothetical protein